MAWLGWLDRVGELVGIGQNGIWGSSLRGVGLELIHLSAWCS